MISIILPVYNGEETISTAVESVLNQSVSDWELIIIDDGSTDRTAQIAAEFKDKRIVYQYQTHRERSVARNHGISLANGSLLLFLDADDWLLPESVELHQHYSKSHPEYEVLTGDGLLCDENKKPLFRFSEQWQPDGLFQRPFENLILDRRVAGQNRSTVRLSFLRDSKIRFDPELSYAEDWLFWLQVFRFGQAMFFPEAVSAYRWHASSTTHKTSLAFRHNQLAVVRKKLMYWGVLKSLSTDEQRHFFYQLLIEDLNADPDEQSAVVKSEHFDALPTPEKARLFRLMAGECLLSGFSTRGSIRWLKRALELEPSNFKTRLLYQFNQLSPRLARRVLKIRRWFSNRSF